VRFTSTNLKENVMKKQKSELPMFRPRLSEEVREKLHSGGTHRNKKAYHRAADKRAAHRQVEDSK
jgi:hypothetical protein